MPTNTLFMTGLLCVWYAISATANPRYRNQWGRSVISSRDLAPARCRCARRNLHLAPQAAARNPPLRPLAPGGTHGYVAVFMKRSKIFGAGVPLSERKRSHAGDLPRDVFRSPQSLRIKGAAGLGSPLPSARVVVSSLDYGGCRAPHGEGLIRPRRARRETLRPPAGACVGTYLQSHGGGPAAAPCCGPVPRSAELAPCRPLRPGARRPRRRPVHGRREGRARPANRCSGLLPLRKRRRFASARSPDIARTRRAGLRHPGRRGALLHVPGNHALLHGSRGPREARLLRPRPPEPDRRAGRGRTS